MNIYFFIVLLMEKIEQVTTKKVIMKKMKNKVKEKLEIVKQNLNLPPT